MNDKEFDRKMKKIKEPSESQIEKKLKQEVEKRGALCFKFVSPENPGVPDRIVLTPDGRTIYVELKTTFGSLQRIQQYQLQRMRENRADVRVVKGMEQVKEFIAEVFGG